jgi:hypothetical protein
MTRMTTDTDPTTNEGGGRRWVPASDDGASPSEGAAGARHRLGGLRGRLLLRFTVLLAITLVVSIVVARAILLSQVNERIHARLVKEIADCICSQARPIRSKRGRSPSTSTNCSDRSSPWIRALPA